MNRIALALVLLSLTAHAETAQELLLRTDRARGNRDGVSWTVSLESHEKERVSTRTYDVTARHFNFLARATEPPRLRGNSLLMKQGSMWFHKPDLSKPMPVSRRQKLSGGAAYGDIAATNYAEDYDIVADRTETKDGRTLRILELKANSKQVTYDQIICHIDPERGVNSYAEYLSVSGKTLKTAEMVYDNQLDGNPFISSMIIHDQLTESTYTVMTFSDPRTTQVPDRTFSIQHMKQ
jgi:hypothetical protein